MADGQNGPLSIHAYNANSEVGVIFGGATKKLLYMGVKNKNCAVCSIAKKKQTEPPSHQCFKNLCGSSTSMEADIIATGFCLSETMHGVRYTQVIGDGTARYFIPYKQQYHLTAEM